jgi:hypothetical protein
MGVFAMVGAAVRMALVLMAVVVVVVLMAVVIIVVVVVLAHASFPVEGSAICSSISPSMPLMCASAAE